MAPAAPANDTHAIVSETRTRTGFRAYQSQQHAQPACLAGAGGCAAATPHAGSGHPRSRTQRALPVDGNVRKCGPPFNTRSGTASMQFAPAPSQPQSDTARHETPHAPCGGEREAKKIRVLCLIERHRGRQHAAPTHAANATPYRIGREQLVELGGGQLSLSRASLGVALLLHQGQEVRKGVRVRGKGATRGLSGEGETCETSAQQNVTRQRAVRTASGERDVSSRAERSIIASPSLRSQSVDGFRVSNSSANVSRC